MQRTQLVLLVPPLARAVARVQDALAHTQVLRGDFQQLVIIDELEALFQRHRMDGNQAHCVFGSGSVAHVGDVLLFADVDDKVIRAGVLTDDHALVNVLLRADEQRAAFLLSKRTMLTEAELLDFDDELIRRGISCGGAADMLAAVIFLSLADEEQRGFAELIKTTL